MIAPDDQPVQPIEEETDRFRALLKEFSAWNGPTVDAYRGLWEWGSLPTSPDVDALLRFHPWVGFVDSLIEFLPPKTGRVLDVGCGPGFSSALLAARGYEVDAADLTIWEGAKHLAQVFGFRLLPECSAGGLTAADDQYDIVFHHHVAEHCLCPLLTLTEAHRVLKRGGWLALGVPISLVAGAGHITYYDESLVAYHLALSGFDASKWLVPPGEEQPWMGRVCAPKTHRPLEFGLWLHGSRLVEFVPPHLLWHQEESSHAPTVLATERARNLLG